MKVTWPGTIMEKRRKRKRACLPGKRSLARA
jgi:hypothetical protein